MCVICLEFQKHHDLSDARRMIAAARNEPNSIDKAHLLAVEKELDEAEATQKD